MKQFVAPFAAIGRQDTAKVGGKGASLGELTSIGVPVPPGYVVTTLAFELALQEIDPRRTIRDEIAALPPDDAAAIAGSTAEIRGHIREAPLPEVISSEIVRHYHALARHDEHGQQPVAVRSSATAEDSADASFAGLQDTFLWVREADDVVSRVRDCWASLYSVESVSYRLRLGIPEDSLAMAVVIQRMVDARSAGVMFTRAPTTGDRSVVAIESSWGLGSALVGGNVTPDSFLVSKVTGEILRREISVKKKRHVPDPVAGGVLEEEVPADLQRQASVEDEEIRELVALARAVEDHYGGAQDIEWAIASGHERGSNIFLLQSRPETAWSRKGRGPLATRKPRAFDHVVAGLGGLAPETNEQPEE